MTGKHSQTTNRRTAIVLGAIAASMVGLAYASVPLYQLFCQVTGYGGTPQVGAAAAPGTGSGRTFTVSFDANVNPKLKWRFRPAQRAVELEAGEEMLAYYEAVNIGDKPLTGTAVFNVTPYKIGQYFTKLDCFCFTEQTLEPGQSVSMPVLFYIDPEIEADVNAAEVKTITLSYTFFPKEKKTAALMQKSEN